jgi:hypothetical protein
VLDAIAVVYPGCARRTKRAAGLRRTYPAMTLNWEIKSVAQAHAVGDASVGTGCFRAAQWGGRIRIGDRGIPEAAEQRLENVLGRGHSHGADKRRDGEAGYEYAFDAAAQAGLATDQQSEGLPRVARRRFPIALSLGNFGGGRKYDLTMPGVRSLRGIAAYRARQQARPHRLERPGSRANLRGQNPGRMGFSERTRWSPDGPRAAQIEFDVDNEAPGSAL